MSRLESDQEFEFVIQNETSDERAGSAFPLTHRQNAIQQFDNESLDQGKTRTVTVPVSADLVKILDSAQTLYEAEDYQPAHSLYEAALKRDHQNEEALTGLAQCAVKMGNNGEALIAIQKLTKLHPNFSNFVWLADELYLSDRIDEAYENYMRAQLEPHIEGEVLFSVFKNLGNIALRKSDLESAEEFYNKAFTLQPDSDSLLVNFGSLAIHRGELDIAVRRFRQAVEINPRNEKGWIGLGMLHREFGDNELAWANVERALDIDKGNETAIKLVSEWAMKDNEIARSIRLIDNYLITVPTDAFIHMMQAKFLYLLARIEEAKIEIEEALKLKPQLQDAKDIYEVIKDELKQREAKFK